jgi:hypothetical protein
VRSRAAGEHDPHGEIADVSLPLQGGLSPADGLTGAVIEIACDESGFSGSNLLDAATPVFAHASVDLGVGEAAELIAALRSDFWGPLNELKSAQFLRGRHGGKSLEWFLDALSGRAHVHLVDKEYFLVTRIVDLFLAEPSYAAGTRLSQPDRSAALDLYRARRPGGRVWSEFLESFVDLVRTKRHRRLDQSAVRAFVGARDSLAAHRLGAAADRVLDELSPTRVRATLQRLIQDDRSIPPPLEPLLPALAETVLFWSGGQRQVLVIHDEQSALTADRLRRLQRVLADGAGLAGRPVGPAGEAASPVSPLAGLVAVDSRSDPRVQVADLLAGVARRVPEAGYDALIGPFLSATSLRDTDQ